MFSISADVQYIVGYYEYIEGYHEYIGGYLEYIRACSVHWRGLMIYVGRLYEYIGCSMRWGDISSSSLGTSYRAAQCAANVQTHSHCSKCAAILLTVQ